MPRIMQTQSTATRSWYLAGVLGIMGELLTLIVIFDHHHTGGKFHPTSLVLPVIAWIPWIRGKRVLKQHGLTAGSNISEAEQADFSYQVASLVSASYMLLILAAVRPVG